MPATYLPYVIRPGDYLTQLAARFGFDANEVWEHPKNSSLRELCDDPEVLPTSEIIYFPQEEPEAFSCESDTTNTFQADVPTMPVEVTMYDCEGPWANEPFKITGAGDVIEGTTDEDGLVSFEVPVTARTVEIVFGNRGWCDTWLIGGLNPVKVKIGRGQRLAGLGYYLPWEWDDEDTAVGQVEDAMRLFCEDERLADKDEGQDETAALDKLRSEYGA